MPNDLPDWVSGASSAATFITSQALNGPQTIRVAAFQSVNLFINRVALANANFCVQADWLTDDVSAFITETAFLTCMAGATGNGAHWRMPVRGGALKLTVIAGANLYNVAAFGSPNPVAKFAMGNDASAGRDLINTSVFVGGTPVIVGANDGLGQDVTLNGDVTISLFSNTTGNLYWNYIAANGVAKLIFISAVAASTSLVVKTPAPCASVNLVFIPSGPNAAGSVSANIQPSAIA